MNCFKPRASHTKIKYAKKDAILNAQRLQILFKDVENLIELSRYSFSKGGRILQRIDQCMDKMDEVGKEVVMEPGQMKKFLEHRKNLERLALEVSSNEIVYR